MRDALAIGAFIGMMVCWGYSIVSLADGHYVLSVIGSMAGVLCYDYMLQFSEPSPRKEHHHDELL
jgi:hypothetical protein